MTDTCHFCENRDGGGEEEEDDVAVSRCEPLYDSESGKLTHALLSSLDAFAKTGSLTERKRLENGCIKVHFRVLLINRLVPQQTDSRIGLAAQVV
jgi:hypothetical protein